MEQEYDNTNRGALFINEKKQSEKHPDYTGSINIAGVEHWLSAWLQTSKKSGKQFLSISIGDVKEEKPSEPAKGFPNGEPVENVENKDEITVEDIPFN